MDSDSFSEDAGSEPGVAAVNRALSILSAFTDGAGTLTLAELAQKTGLYKSTILRLIASLEHAGYLRRLSSSKYQLGPQLLYLGSLYQQTFNLGDHLQPELEQLAASTGESAAFYVREGDSKVCLYRVNSTQHVVLRYIQNGYRTELARGASGQILLAFTEPHRSDLQVIRDAPLTVSLERRESGTAAIACPVFGVTQTFHGALVLAGPLTRFSPEKVRELAPPMLDAAIRATRSLGGDPHLLLSLRSALPLTVV